MQIPILRGINQWVFLQVPQRLFPDNLIPTNEPSLQNNKQWASFRNFLQTSVIGEKGSFLSPIMRSTLPYLTSKSSQGKTLILMVQGENSPLRRKQRISFQAGSSLGNCIFKIRIYPSAPLFVAGLEHILSLSLTFCGQFGTHPVTTASWLASCFSASQTCLCICFLAWSVASLGHSLITASGTPLLSRRRLEAVFPLFVLFPSR